MSCHCSICGGIFGTKVTRIPFEEHPNEMMSFCKLMLPPLVLNCSSPPSQMMVVVSPLDVAMRV